ncbi:hypothetical protein ASG76_00220 [Nocardioides sp. Soil774]|uniref:hypothetical protein n=1 Tax=Nocardioides sp. Soil774 TaxID=1736408 RepID=UPI0006F4D277|nr:hypothetical protein [Nocardioides sp. Soil774]KRE97197.1 hypothetical protein ASG76_00220 [Nocardioides sp. Soil774]
MNHTAIDITARIAATHRQDVARDIASARTARAARRTRTAVEPAVTEVPSPRRGGWSRWLPAPRPAL